MRASLFILFVVGPSADLIMPTDAGIESASTVFEEIDKPIVQMAMARSDDGAAIAVLELLPLPESSDQQSTDYALRFRSAWIDRTTNRHLNDDAIENVRMFAFAGGRRMYSEWACATGQDTSVGEKVVALLPQVVTTYPERLLLRGSINERRRYGYDVARRCDRNELAAARSSFDRYHSEVSKLVGKTQ